MPAGWYPPPVCIFIGILIWIGFFCTFSLFFVIICINKEGDSLGETDLIGRYFYKKTGSGV